MRVEVEWKCLAADRPRKGSWIIVKFHEYKKDKLFVGSAAYVTDTYTSVIGRTICTDTFSINTNRYKTFRKEEWPHVFWDYYNYNLNSTRYNKEVITEPVAIIDMYDEDTNRLAKLRRKAAEKRRENNT